VGSGQQDGGVIRLEIVRNQQGGDMSCVGDLRIMLFDDAPPDTPLPGTPLPGTLLEEEGRAEGGGGVLSLGLPPPPPSSSCPPPPSLLSSGSSSKVAESGISTTKQQNLLRSITEDERKDSIGMIDEVVTLFFSSECMMCCGSYFSIMYLFVPCFCSCFGRSEHGGRVLGAVEDERSRPIQLWKALSAGVCF
jgi:hypothetical protein